MMGHTYPGMFDVASSIALTSSSFGGHVEILEFQDLRVR
jgi:L-arabinose isomerase